MTTSPTPTNLLNRRIVDRLAATHHPASGNFEPQWSATIIQRVLAATAEVIIEAVANGEEVQLGRLGRFYPKVTDERTVVNNLVPTAERVSIPRRMRVEFDPTPYAEAKVKDLFNLVEELTMVVEAAGK